MQVGLLGDWAKNDKESKSERQRQRVKCFVFLWIKEKWTRNINVCWWDWLTQITINVKRHRFLWGFLKDKVFGILGYIQYAWPFGFSLWAHHLLLLLHKNCLGPKIWPFVMVRRFRENGLFKDPMTNCHISWTGQFSRSQITIFCFKLFALMDSFASSCWISLLWFETNTTH